MIHVSRLTKRFGSIRALDEISFDVQEREVVGFLGPNGAGKTTTLRVLTGFLTGDAGTVRVAGHDVSRDSIAVRRSIGYLPEGVPLYPEMRTIEFLRFRAALKGISRRARVGAIGAALERVGIVDVRRQVIGTLSKGYRQRVGLADALLGDPKVLILDEPTVGLDPEQVIQFRKLLREIGQDRTVLLSTHILSEVELVCSGAIIIHRGRIAAQDSAENLRQRVQGMAPVIVEIDGPEQLVRQTLSRMDDVESVVSAPVDEVALNDGDSEAVTGEFHRFLLRPKPGRDPRVAVFLLAREKGWTMRELRREPIPLEEAFLDIVSNVHEEEVVAER